MSNGVDSVADAVALASTIERALSMFADEHERLMRWLRQHVHELTDFRRVDVQFGVLAEVEP